MIMTALTTLAVASVYALDTKIVSPNGQIAVAITDEGGRPMYQVERSGQTVLMPSPLGVKLNFADLTEGVKMQDYNVTPVSDTYELKTIKQSHVTYEANEGVCQFAKNGWHAMDVIIRVSNRDIAIRYKLYPKKVRNDETRVAVVQSEATGFVLPDGTLTYLCPQSKPMGALHVHRPAMRPATPSTSRQARTAGARAIPSPACSRFRLLLWHSNKQDRCGCCSARQAPTATMSAAGC